MEIHFKTHVPEDEIGVEVAGQTQRKLGALTKYLGKESEDAQVYVELGKDSAAHHKGDFWRAQINLDSKGKRYHADAHAEKIELAVDEAIKDIERELDKAKEQHKNVIRKGGMALKSLLREES